MEEARLLWREIYGETEELSDQRDYARSLLLLAEEEEELLEEDGNAAEYYLEAVFHFDAVVAQTSLPEDERALVRCGYDAALCTDFHGDRPKAEELAERTYNRARALYDETESVEEARSLALLCCSLSEWAADREEISRSLAMAKECLAHWRRVVAESENAVDRRRFAMDAESLGNVLWEQELTDSAVAAFEESYLVWQGVFDRTGRAEDLRELIRACRRTAEVAHEMGRAEREEECRREALAMCLAVFEETQNKKDGMEVTGAYLDLADLTLAQERRGEAYRYYRSALAAAEKVSWDYGIHRARAGMAKLLP
jgi:tetratricopeptide (TPR) repeat protein